MQRKALSKARGRKSTAPIIRKPARSNECTLETTVSVTDTRGNTRTVEGARTIREAMRMEGDKG
jgi:hypothetical protein